MAPAPALERFYPIVPDADWVARILPLGVRLVQLRIKGEPEAVVRVEVRRAQAVCRAHGAQLVVNDYWEIAIAEGCDFVHLGQEDLAAADLGAIRRAGVRFGVSTHDEAELDRALAAEPAYVALGPIYETKLKKMPWAPQGLARVGEWKRRIGALPLVAIGGLTVERVPAVLAAGADSLALVTDIVTCPEPEARVRAWLEVTRAGAGAA